MDVFAEAERLLSMIDTAETSRTVADDEIDELSNCCGCFRVSGSNLCSCCYEPAEFTDERDDSLGLPEFDLLDFD